MKAVVRRRHRSRQDLIEIFRYLARDASFTTARRFLAEAEAAFGRLAEMPGIGTRYEPESLSFPEIRFFPITRFKKYVVFYTPITGGIDIIRILHGARDIQSILADDFDVDSGKGEEPTLSP
jgi:toxin ParE1/3/4